MQTRPSSSNNGSTRRANTHCPNRPSAQKNYNEAVRYYTIKSTNGAIRFKCICCEHTVATFDFERRNGNQRTQAAAAMNQHAGELHSRLDNAAFVKSVSRGSS